MFDFLGETAKNIFMTFFIAMTPVLELRGAIPAGYAAGLDLIVVIPVAIIGNVVPVPFIIIFIRKIFKWMQTKSERMARLVKKLEDRAESKKEQVMKYEFWGLMILVAIPLPGTGAWTGALVAAMLDMRLGRALPAIIVGVIVAAVVVSIATFGVSAIF